MANQTEDQVEQTAARRLEIEEQVRQIIVRQLDVDESEVVPEASFVENLKADSLDLVELVMALEEAFKIDILDEDSELIRTVQDAFNYIQRRIG